MGETAASNPAEMQVSVSFGRFENDSLCWEKWSTFSPNKYLEEVEKCATPGSVAQKKAYFEAHYKNIAARKAELLAQEKQTEEDPCRSQYQNVEDPSCSNTCGTDAEFGISSTQGSVEGVIKQETNSIDEIIRTNVNNDFKEDVVVAVSREYTNSSVEKGNEELESGSHSSQIDKPEVVCVEQEESPNIEVEDVKEVPHNVDNETAKASEVKAKDATFDHPKVSKKVTPLNKESNEAKIKKKLALHSSKSSQISTPKSSRPTSTPTKILASANSTNRVNSSSSSGRRVTSTGENRKVTSKSLHMSLSIDPSKSDHAPQTTMRKSLFMEEMGDKDIVKRVFKSFQNSFNQPKTSYEDKYLAKAQVPSRGTETRVPTSVALRKENGRSPKVDSMDKRNGNAIRPTLGLKSETVADKRKESSRKVEEKFNAKQVERTHIQLNSKDEKIKHNSRATPLPGGQKVSKSHPEKEGR